MRRVLTVREVSDQSREREKENEPCGAELGLKTLK